LEECGCLAPQILRDPTPLQQSRNCNIDASDIARDAAVAKAAPAPSSRVPGRHTLAMRSRREFCRCVAGTLQRADNLARVHEISNHASIPSLKGSRMRRLPSNCVRLLRLRTIALLALVAVTALLTARPSASDFTSGDIVVYRVGTGSGSLANTGNPVFLDEYSTAGALVQSTALPTAASGSNKQLIASGTATSEGLLTLSADGHYLVATGYAANIPTTGLAGTAASSVNRVIGRIDAARNVDTSTALTDWATGNNPRSGASVDGRAFWLAGAAGSPAYATLGATTSTQLSTTVPNLRQAEIFGSQLYVSDSSGSTVRIGSISGGLPTTSGQTITNLPGFPTSGSPYAFFLADLSAGVAGLDTLYVADDGAGLLKYSLVGGAWTSNGTVGTASDAYRGLTASVSGTTVTLFATRKGGSGATGGGELVKLVDSNGYNAAFSATTPTLLATAATNTAFRGVAFAPTSIAPSILTQPSDITINSGTSTTLTALADGTGPLTYHWYQGTAPDTTMPVGSNSPSFSTGNLASTTKYWVRVTSAYGSIDSVTATVTVLIVIPPPTINSGDPGDKTIPYGTTANLSVGVTGTGPFTYKWYQGSAPSTASGVLGSNSSFTTPPLTANANYWVQVSNQQGGTGGIANSRTATVTVLAACAVGSSTAISQVQGIGETSPFAAAGQTATVQGVVVGDYEGGTGTLSGFYLQDDEPNRDPAASEGIFVFEANGANSVNLGDVVQVTGPVSEFQGQTEITATTIASCGTTATVAPTVVALPVAPSTIVNGETVSYLERFEGMLVRFEQKLYVTEIFHLGQFNEITMSASGRLPVPTAVTTFGPAAQAQEAANQLNRILVDDNRQDPPGTPDCGTTDPTKCDPDPVYFAENGLPLSASNTLRGGDTATGVTGVMTYTGGGYSSSPSSYRVRTLGAMNPDLMPGTPNIPSFDTANPRPTTPPTVGGRLKVVGMNVLNFFLSRDDGSITCGVGNLQECRGWDMTGELKRQQDKLNAALMTINADVVGFSELENTAGVDPLGDIVSRLNASLQMPVYDYINTGTVGTDAIKVGIMYRRDKVTPDVGGFFVDNNPVHNRAPLAQSFFENQTGEKFTVVVNHFRAKSCTGSSTGLNADQGDGQGCNNAYRTAQAQATTDWVKNTVLPAVGDPDVLLIGDFNAYANEAPIKLFEANGYTNLVKSFQGMNAYSYVFNGEWGYIDQALASASLLPRVTGAADFHINADEPTALDYNLNFKTTNAQSILYAQDMYRIADHDPVFIGLSLPSAQSQANPDSGTAESGMVLDGSSVLANDANGPFAIVSHTNPTNGTLTLNNDGTFTYVPAAGFAGPDSFTYTASNAGQLFTTHVTPLTTIGAVPINGAGWGSALAPVPGSPTEFYGLTDRGPNVDGPNGTKVEPIPSFTPSIARMQMSNGEAIVEQVIPLLASDGTPFSGRVNSQASTGETITDLNGAVLPADPNGFDSEGLVALPDGTFWVSDEYGPFISHFTADGHEIQRLSPFAGGGLPAELAMRLANRGMEGLAITADGSTLVGMMQSALQQTDLGGADAKKQTPVRIVTYQLAAPHATHEYLYLLDEPGTNKTAVSEITALSNTQFIVDERDGNFLPGAYKKIFRIDLTGATDVGPAASIVGATYDAANGGLLVGGKSIEKLLKGLGTADSTTALKTAKITPVTKSLFLDLGGLLNTLDPTGHFFSHDKFEGMAIVGSNLFISNDSDFGIDGVTTSVPPFELHEKVTAAGIQDNGEFLSIDLTRPVGVTSTATVTITTDDTIAPETSITNGPPTPTAMTNASFEFTASDSGTGVKSIACSLDGGAFIDCASPVNIGSLGDGPHTFAVQATDKANNVDPTPASYPWLVDSTAPETTIDTHPANPIASAAATFTFHGTDGGSGVASLQCSLDGAPFATCTSPQNLGPLMDGSHTFRVRAIDNAGNVDLTPDSFTWLIDTTAPAITSVTASVPRIWPLNKTMVAETITVIAHDAVTATPVCSITGVTSNEPGPGQWQINGPLTLTLLADRLGSGTGRIYTISVACHDDLGNTSQTSTTMVIVPHDQGQ
jgi:predicted extracellular nuclease